MLLCQAGYFFFDLDCSLNKLFAIYHSILWPSFLRRGTIKLAFVIFTSTFQNETPHFLDLEINPYGISIFRKDTFTGQYVSIESFTTQKWKTALLSLSIAQSKFAPSSQRTYYYQEICILEQLPPTCRRCDYQTCFIKAI